jgi:chemotaxis protein MotB
VTGKEKSKIIVKKVKKGGHGGHHGGSWKVAYADFVTAMMAFFMVMWILGMDESTKKAVEGYFSNPVGYKKGYSAGASPIGAGGSPPSVMKSEASFILARSHQTEEFHRVGEEIRRRVASVGELGGLAAQVEIVVTEEGLRIELMEDRSGELFFAFGASTLKPPARRALEIIAQELRGIANPVVVEGHTDAAPFARPGFSNWELSADRANATRRAIEAGGIPAARIVEVRGYADRVLKNPDNPLDPRNRRMSLLLPFTDPQPPVRPARREQPDASEPAVPTQPAEG